MKRLILLTTLLVLTLSGWAQKYEIDVVIGDSADVTCVSKKDTVFHAEEVAPFKLADGETIEAIGKTDNQCPVFLKNGKYYSVYKGNVVFSKDNAPGTANIIPINEKYHSAGAHLYATLFPYIVAFLLFACAFIFMQIGYKVSSLHTLSIKVVPCLLAAGSLIEVGAYYYLGEDAFWWCSDGRHFFSSLLRVIPLVLVVIFQVFCFKGYGRLIFPNGEGKLPIIPTSVSLLLFIPLTFVYFLVVNVMLKYDNFFTELIGTLVFLGSLGSGILYTWRKNTKTLGTKMGTAITLFTLVYLIGLLIAAVSACIVILRLLLQIVIVCVGFSAMGAVFGGAGRFLGGIGGCIGGGGAKETINVWVDQMGGQHTSRSAAVDANERSGYDSDNVRMTQIPKI